MCSSEIEVVSYCFAVDAASAYVVLRKTIVITISLNQTVLDIAGIQLGVLLLAVHTRQACSIVGNWCVHSSEIAFSHGLMWSSRWAVPHHVIAPSTPAWYHSGGYREYCM